jgi:SAM-dependent methyltransferase
VKVARDFDGIYRQRTNRLPWHSGAPDVELIDVVRRGIVPVGRALDVGCGQGTESVFLALMGVRTTGIDLSPRAIGKARALARLLGARPSFRVANVLRLPFRRASFDFVSDRGCFHSLDPSDRERYLEQVSRVLAPRGLLLLRVFSTRAPADSRPHRFTRARLRALLGVRFRPLWTRLVPLLSAAGPPAIPVWACLARRR